MKKYLITLIAILFTASTVYAKGLPKSLNSAFSDTGISKSVVSISIKSLTGRKKHYELNGEKPMMPASAQKIITIIPSMKILGEKYNFTTKLYKDKTKEEYYLVLGADPYLTRKELKNLLGYINLPKDKPISKFYIDDTILDKNEWGEGWQWDDDLNPLMPKFSAYNIDNNLVTINIEPMNNQPPNVTTEVFYPVAFMNYIENGQINDIKILRKNYISAQMLTLEGEIVSNTQIRIPVNNVEQYFKLRLKESLKLNKLSYYGKFESKKLPAENVILLGEIKHPISLAAADTLQNSNNLVAETVFKLAGAKYAKAQKYANMQGSFDNAFKMLQDYCTKNYIDMSSVRIVDGSGVSKNNLTTADFMTDFLVKTANNYGYEETKELFTKPNNEEGTLKNRMLYLSDNLRAKTGTLTDVSSLIGYIETRKGNVYAFSIFVNDPKSNKRVKKSFEEYILREIYRSL